MSVSRRDVIEIIKRELSKGTIFGNRIKDLAGPYDPNGTESAASGSLFRRTGAGAGLYVNMDGGTGWQRVKLE